MRARELSQEVAPVGFAWGVAWTDSKDSLGRLYTRRYRCRKDGCNAILYFHEASRGEAGSVMTAHVKAHGRKCACGAKVAQVGAPRCEACL